MSQDILYILTTIAAFAVGLLYMRGRQEKAKIKFDSWKGSQRAHDPRRDVEIEKDLEEIGKELEGQPVPKELQFEEEKPAQVLKFKKREPEETALVSLEEALKSTRSGIFGRIKGLFTDHVEASASDLESIEEVLYTSDLGPHTVQKLIGAVTEKIEHSEKKDLEVVRGALRDEMIQIFETTQGQVKPVSRFFESGATSEHKPEIWMIVGVNGAGKTTTIGKLAHKLASNGKGVLIAAGDTFRAAAGEQLKIWSERAKVEIFAPEGIESPSAVAFDACKLAQQKAFDHLIIDTAGRLHTQKNLMEELKKVKRVIEKTMHGAPHEVLLVLDANSGQNALIQAREFHAALGVTGVVLTKLDGTAKGGMAVGVAAELNIPIQLIGVGEGKDDIRPFQPKEFVDAIV